MIRSVPNSIGTYFVSYVFMNPSHLPNILLIDDDPDDIDLFHHAVSDVSPRSELHSFDNCKEALGQIEKNSIAIPDVIFVDLVMPVTTGVECIKMIKKNPLLKDIPMMALSTSSNPSNLDELYNIGVSYFITKPPSLAKLKVAINYMVNLPTRNIVQTKDNFHFKF